MDNFIDRNRDEDENVDGGTLRIDLSSFSSGFPGPYEWWERYDHEKYGWKIPKEDNGHYVAWELVPVTEDELRDLNGVHDQFYDVMESQDELRVKG